MRLSEVWGTKKGEGKKEYFSPRRYIIYERAKFFRRVQAEGESVEQFIRALNESADRCEFPDRRVLQRSEIA